MDARTYQFSVCGTPVKVVASPHVVLDDLVTNLVLFRVRIRVRGSSVPIVARTLYSREDVSDLIGGEPSLAEWVANDAYHGWKASRRAKALNLNRVEKTTAT